MLRCWALMVLLCTAFSARAALTIDIVGAGERQIPIAVVPFANDGKLAQSISDVIAQDLKRSGIFRLVDSAAGTPHELNEVSYADWTNVDNLVIGSVETQPGNQVMVKFRLLDVVKQVELFGQVSVRGTNARFIGHRAADLIYEKLTGTPGSFSTRIAYVARQGRKNSLTVADSDGYGELAIKTISEPIMSPAWSPDGNQLAYVTLESGHAVVYIQTLATTHRMVLSDARGSNSAPTWAPDGKHLAVVLTRDGSPQIYLIRSDGGDLRRLTFGGSIDTEPSFSPDGRSLLFTSDRGGSAQIYKMSLGGGAAERLTFEGGNNFSPRYSPDGKSFVFAHQANGRFYIAVQDFQSKQMQLLTEGGWEKKPSFSPNGKLVLFGIESGARGTLATVPSDGRIKYSKLKDVTSAQIQDLREPTWGPLLK